MNKDIYVNRYLERIKCNDIDYADLENLKKLQRGHLLNIPFENLDIHTNKKIKLDTQSLWHKIVEEKRGGICYELNGLFLTLLKELGYNVKYLSGNISEQGNEFDHALILVKINEEYYIIDVGYKDNFFEPKKLILNEIQSDIKGNFKIVKLDEEKYQLIRVLDDSNEQIQFTFTLVERNIEDFKDRCIEFETLHDSYFRKNKFCAIEKENGKVFLRDDKLVITENNNIQTKEFKNEEEFITNLKSIFGIEFSL